MINDAFSPMPARPCAPTFGEESPEMIQHTTTSPIHHQQHQRYDTPYSPSVFATVGDHHYPSSQMDARGLAKLRGMSGGGGSSGSLTEFSPQQGLSPSPAMAMGMMYGEQPQSHHDHHDSGGGELYGLSPPSSAVNRAMDNVAAHTVSQQQHHSISSGGGNPHFETPRTTLRARVTRDKVLNAAVVLNSPMSSSSRSPMNGYSSGGSPGSENDHSPPPGLDRKQTATFHCYAANGGRSTSSATPSSYVTPNRCRQQQLQNIGGKEVPVNFLTPQQGGSGGGLANSPLSEVHPNLMHNHTSKATTFAPPSTSTFLTTVDLPSAVRTAVLTVAEELTLPAGLTSGTAPLFGTDQPSQAILPQVLGGGLLSPTRFMTAQQEANAAVARSILLASPPQRVHSNGRVVVDMIPCDEGGEQQLLRQVVPKKAASPSSSPATAISPEQLRTMAGDSVSLLKRKHLQRMVQVGFEHPGALLSPSSSRGGVAGKVASPNQTKVAFTPHPPPRKPK